MGIALIQINSKMEGAMTKLDEERLKECVEAICNMFTVPDDDTETFYAVLDTIKGYMFTKKCVECGEYFYPYEQGDIEDRSCQNCIDIRNA